MVELRSLFLPSLILLSLELVLSATMLKIAVSCVLVISVNSKFTTSSEDIPSTRRPVGTDLRVVLDSRSRVLSLKSSDSDRLESRAVSWCVVSLVEDSSATSRPDTTSTRISAGTELRLVPRRSSVLSL